MFQKIVTDRKLLSIPCQPCKNIQEGEKIGELLLAYLEKTSDGVGLAANQLGLKQKVCVINVEKPIILVNPEIVGRFEKIEFIEACLSFAGDYINTERYANIAVKADNHSETLFFDKNKNLLECICVQHEIDHLNGITMYERQIKGDKDGHI